MKKSNYYPNCIALFVVASVLSSSVNAVDLTSNYVKPVGIPKHQLTRDPFSPSALMYEVRNQKNMLGSTTNMYGLPSGGLSLPKIKLIGFIEQEGDETVALLEIAGFGTQVVRKGDELTLDPTQPHNKLLISDISRKGVIADMGMLGTFRILK